jgi:hypothetical protein
MKPTQKLMSASWAALRGQGALASCVLAVAGHLAACAGEVFLTISLLLPAVAGSAAEGAANLPVPTPQQVAWHEAGIGLFFHWAPNVYQGGEGDNRSTPRDKINPDRFNAGQWVQAVKAANAGYMIFVAKHVGGYCAWQTGTTDYSLKTSPWNQGLPGRRRSPGRLSLSA